METPSRTIFIPYHAFDNLVLRGIRAAQPPAATVVPGTLYSVTDESNRLERSNGIVWEEYAGGAEAGGPAGPQGPIGPTGAQGPQGPEGPEGPQGPQGVIGPEGPTGETGDTGAIGPEGAPGEPGATGPQGAEGLEGPKGDTGDTGPQGIQGVQGIQGEIGPEGPKGDQGDPSPSASWFPYRMNNVTSQNDPGAGNLRWNNVDQLAATSLYLDWLTTDGFDADLIFAALQPGSFIYVQDKDLAVVYQKWELVEYIGYADWFELRVTLLEIGGQGTMDNNKPLAVIVVAVAPEGPVGETGPPGPIGPQGEQGIQGEQGPQGVPTTPGGATTQVQYNDAGTFGGDAALTFNKATKILALEGNPRITKDFPGVTLVHPSAPVDQRAWNIITIGTELHLQTITDAATGQGASPLFVNRGGDVTIRGALTVNGTAALVKGVRPSVALYTPGDTQYARFFSAIPGGRVDITTNLVYNGNQWLKDDPSKPGGLMTLAESGDWGVWKTPAGANPATLIEQIRVDALGSFSAASYKTRIGTWTFVNPNLTLDLFTGGAFEANLGGVTNFIFGNPPPTGVEFVFSLQINNYGAYQHTFPATVTWDEDVVPTFPGAGRSTILGFSTINGGARWRGYIGGRNFAT